MVATPKTDADSATSNPLSRKLQKVLSLKLDNDPDLLVALKGLSTVVKTNNLRTRRNLRGDFERRSVQLSEELCDSFSRVDQLVDQLSSEITWMSECCNEMSTKLANSRQKMSGLLEKTSKIKRESESVEMKKEVITAFIARYHISPQQNAVLKRSTLIDEEFFTVMSRVKTIHQDCKSLLQSHKTTGLQIMEHMALQQETAYQTLFKWSQNECRHLSSDMPEPPATLKQAFVMLKDRDSLFRSCVDEMIKVRRAALLRMFINSLTKGGPGGTPKPIELSSHDPIRYTGDMLAWLHQSIASEKDFLSSLINDKECVLLAMSGVTEAGLCRTLQIRVEQVLNNTDDPIVLLKICNIAQFYLSTIKPFLRDTAPLLQLIKALCVQCTNQFNRHVILQITRLTDRSEQPGSDLLPTLAFQEALHLLKVILNTHDISVVVDVSPADVMAQLLDTVITPILALCLQSSVDLNPVDCCVYLTNTYTCLYNVLVMYESTDVKLQLLQSQIEDELDKLSQLQYDHMLRTVQAPPPDLLTSERLHVLSNKLDMALCNTELFWLQQCTKLSTLKHRNSVWKNACSNFVQFYTSLFTSPLNSDPDCVLLKTPKQITDLLK